MSFGRKVLLVFVFPALMFFNIRLVFVLIGGQKEVERLELKTKILLEKEKQLREAFFLKQDYMRKLLTDREFAEQIIRQKEGCIKTKESIIKFED